MPGPLKVLIVEDNDAFRLALELLFELRDDIEVVGSLGDGSQAVDSCRELGPEVVLLDYRLPGLDGVEVARAVRDACPEVVVVGLTGGASESEREEFRDAGVAVTLTKDEHLDTIVAALHRAAGRLAA